jgi:hypothetical protein
MHADVGYPIAILVCVVFQRKILVCNAFQVTCGAPFTKIVHPVQQVKQRAMWSHHVLIAQLENINHKMLLQLTIVNCALLVSTLIRQLKLFANLAWRASTRLASERHQSLLVRIANRGNLLYLVLDKVSNARIALLVSITIWSSS